MRYNPTPTAIRCPFCQTPISVPVHRIVDAVDQPELKPRLLSGQLNAFTCPHCPNSGAPTAKRKAYLFQPQQFFTLQSLVDAILGADGITPEMIQTQQARIDLLRRLLETRDEAAFETLVRENDAAIDDAFIRLVTVAMASAQAV